MCFEQKEVGHGVVDKQQGLGTPGEEEPRINVNQDVTNGHRAIQVSDGSLVLQSLPQGSVVCWDRFLPIRSLKFLLVKNDDSTRHVVSALLRNCCYEVNAVANGLQAWKILEDLNNHINLVLKEGVMPIFSGIGLLCKLMRHKSLKNIPVIMMSSHDSMGIVFKCLSKGVVDFLVKPIRKNGLKNLWQHLWRRCHSKFPFALTSQRHYKLPGIDSQPFEGKLDHKGENISSSAKFKQTFDSLNGVSDISQFPTKSICFLMCQHIKIQSDILLFPLLCRYNTPSSANQVICYITPLLTFVLNHFESESMEECLVMEGIDVVKAMVVGMVKVKLYNNGNRVWSYKGSLFHI
ncbi:hypothetical protein UlMin_003309 [Ulmus minor]